VKKNSAMTTSVDEKKEIDELVADFFFGCNVPFSVVDSNHFKNLVHKLRPSYMPPCSKTLRTTLLDNRYEQFSEKPLNYSDKSSPILIDGWKNESNNSKNVSVMMHSVLDEPVFLEAFDFTTLSENGVELARIVDKSQEISRDKYQIDTYAVVSDNAPAMLRMGRLSNLWHISCSSHTGDLLARDIIDVPTTDKVNSVIKEFKHPNLEDRVVSLGNNFEMEPKIVFFCLLYTFFFSFRRPTYDNSGRHSMVFVS
jgi:Protein of unknown function (DUF 659)